MLRSGNDRKSSWVHPKESGSSHQGPWLSKANGNGGGGNNNVKYIRASNFHLLGHNKAYTNISKSTNALDYASTKVNPKQYPYYAPMSVSSHHSSSRLPNSNKINSAAIDYNSRKHFSQLQQPQKCTCSSNNNNNNYCNNDLKVQSHYRNMQMQRSSRLATNQSKLFEIAR